jgi:hypothetical protein
VRLASDTAEEYELLRVSLFEALKAEREMFATCDHCRHRTRVVVPDWTARVKAIETLLNQGLGRPEPEQTSCPRCELSRRLAEMSREERHGYQLFLHRQIECFEKMEEFLARGSEEALQRLLASNQTELEYSLRALRDDQAANTDTAQAAAEGQRIT